MLRNDSHANWKKQENSFVPLDGEMIIYDIDENNEIQQMKIGDGKTLLKDLPFINHQYLEEMPIRSEYFIFNCIGVGE